MNGVLDPGPAVRDGVHPVEDDVISKQIHPRTWKMAKNCFFHAEAQRMEKTTRDMLQPKENPFWGNQRSQISSSEINRNVLFAIPPRKSPKRSHKSLKMSWNQCYGISPKSIARWWISACWKGLFKLFLWLQNPKMLRSIVVEEPEQNPALKSQSFSNFFKNPNEHSNVLKISERVLKGFCSGVKIS